jgi:hypothetical protein
LKIPQKAIQGSQSLLNLLSPRANRTKSAARTRFNIRPLSSKNWCATFDCHPELAAIFSQQHIFAGLIARRPPGKAAHFKKIFGIQLYATLTIHLTYILELLQN